MEEDLEFSSLAAAIKGARERAGFTQKQAAALAEVHGRTWQDWERGLGDARMNVRRIEAALELERDYFAAKLTVLERLFVLEKQLEKIESLIRENTEVLRDVRGFLRVTADDKPV